MWWYSPYWYRRWWRFSVWPAFAAYVAGMLVVGLAAIAVMWPLSLWGHALGMAPSFSQLLARNHGWMHEHYPLVGLRYIEALLALIGLVVAIAWATAERGRGRDRLLKYLQAASLMVLILHFVLPGGSSRTTVPASLIDKPLDTAKAELNGFGIHYQAVGNPAGPGGLVDSSGPTVCQTRPAAGRPATRSVTLIVKFTCATSSVTVPPDLIGKQLDISEAELRSLGITYNEIDASHSAFGILEPSNWVVCQTYPPSGAPLHRPVQLFAHEDGC